MILEKVQTGWTSHSCLKEKFILLSFSPTASGCRQRVWRRSWWRQSERCQGDKSCASERLIEESPVADAPLTNHQPLTWLTCCRAQCPTLALPNMVAAALTSLNLWTWTFPPVPCLDFKWVMQIRHCWTRLQHRTAEVRLESGGTETWTKRQLMKFERNWILLATAGYKWSDEFWLILSAQLGQVNIGVFDGITEARVENFNHSSLVNEWTTVRRSSILHSVSSFYNQ